MSEWLTIPSAAAHEADARAWWGEALAQRSRAERAEAERDALSVLLQSAEGPVPDDDPVRPLGEYLAKCLDSDYFNHVAPLMQGVRAALAALREEAGKALSAAAEMFTQVAGASQEQDADTVFQWAMNGCRECRAAAARIGGDGDPSVKDQAQDQSQGG